MLLKFATKIEPFLPRNLLPNKNNTLKVINKLKIISECH